MADFGGWDMPIEYPADLGGGVLNEHQAVRDSVGVFDVSHLGKLEVSGIGSKDFLNSILTNDLRRINDGQAQYSMLCDPADGGVVDDLIVYQRSIDRFLLIPNAANAASVLARLQSSANSEISIEDRHLDFAVIAIQGPRTFEVMRELGFTADLDYMSFAEIELSGISAIVCRTGYTGELGFEILPKWSDAKQIWSSIVEMLPKYGGLIAGLGARDTLRTEMGYPLHGHELSLEITPVQAGANWAVGWNKDAFWGKEILANERAIGAKRILRAFKLLDRGIPRAGMDIYRDEERVGTLTSGTFSPTLKIGIGIGLVDPEVKLGEVIEIDVRGRKLRAEVVKLPFVPSRVR